jgi:hypothetical protein
LTAAQFRVANSQQLEKMSGSFWHGTVGHWNKRIYASRKDAEIAKGDSSPSFFLCTLGGLARGSLGCGRRPRQVSLRLGVSAREDFLEFVVDGVRQDSISGTSEWQKKVFSITGSSTHTLQWQYTKDGSDSYGSDCGWVDYVQWPTMLTDWDTVSYTYGRNTGSHLHISHRGG